MTFYANPGVNADHVVARDGRICKLDGEALRYASDIPPPSDNPNTWVGYVEPPSFPLLYRGKNQRMDWASSAWLATLLGSPSSTWTRLQTWMLPATIKK